MILSKNTKGGGETIAMYIIWVIAELYEAVTLSNFP